MTVSWRHWLPDGCADRSDVRAELAAVVADWTLAWFAIPQLGEPDFGRPAGEVPLSGDLKLSVDPSEVARLGALAAEMADAGDDLAGADQAVLRGLGDEMLADLRRRFEQRLITKEGQGGSAPAELEIRFGPRGRRPTVRIAFAAGPLVRLAKSLMPPASAMGEPVSAAMSGLTDTRVLVEATLGSAQLTLGDLQGLSPGDVLVLDTPLDGVLRLSIKGSDDLLAAARLSQDTEALTLVVGR